jgi:hypothetical protein
VSSNVSRGGAVSRPAEVKCEVSSGDNQHSRLLYTLLMLTYSSISALSLVGFNGIQASNMYQVAMVLA